MKKIPTSDLNWYLKFSRLSRPKNVYWIFLGLFILMIDAIYHITIWFM